MLVVDQKHKAYLSPLELAERWGMDYKTIYKAVIESKIPSVKAGRLYRIAVQEIERRENSGVLF